MKNLLAKTVIDTLDFIEYFCANSDQKNELFDKFIGYQWLLESITRQSLSAEYSKLIIELVGDYLDQEINLPHIDYNDLELFVDQYKNNISTYAIEQRGLTKAQCKKYEIFEYNPLDSKNDFKSLNNYFMFNDDYFNEYNNLLKFYDKNIESLYTEYTVFVSRDLNNKINNISFRTPNTYIQNNVFKYLFSFGNCATFGLNFVPNIENVILTEGVFDMIAGQTLGYNVIGLGSTKISTRHLSYMEPIKNKFLLLDSDIDADDKRIEGIEMLSLPNMYKDPYEYYINGIDIFSHVLNDCKLKKDIFLNKNI